jgi:hypothetical protein
MHLLRFNGAHALLLHLVLLSGRRAKKLRFGKSLLSLLCVWSINSLAHRRSRALLHGVSLQQK